MSDSESPPSTPNDQPVRGGARRASASLRRENAAGGAWLIKFDEVPPDQSRDLFRRPPPAGYQPVLANVGGRVKQVKEYRTMERKGFKVTKDIGCLIPHAQYATYQGGHKLKGHQRSVAFFARWCPKAKQQEGSKNQFGWPAPLQVSHLCHRRSCCRIDHLIVEEQWRNQKRNYCGENGVCDCGSLIKCLRRYHDEKQVDVPELCRTVEEVEAALVGAPGFRILQSGHFADEDEKRKQRNRKKRERAGSKNALQGEKKAAKKAKKQKLSPVPPYAPVDR